MPGQSCSVGVPNILNILKIWSISVSPLKKGYFVTISTKIQPIDQISIGVEYSSDPKRTSGALYHNVTTYAVYGLIGMENILAKPKSPILAVYLSSSNIF